jgi:hypothetical protein
MSTFELLEKYVKSKTSNLGYFPEVVQKGINTINGEIPFKLKLSITLSELITFSSHLRKSISLFDGTLVPTNAIVFALSASGTSKDKSLNAIRKSLHTAYYKLEEKRKDYAKDKARKMAVGQGDTREDWQKYYLPPKPLQAGLGTVEGLLHHFSDIASNPLGAGSILSTEIGSDLQTNGAMTDIIKTIAVAYDLGNVPPKIVKSVENQTSSIKGLPINALLFGSQEALLYNNDIKSRFKLIFNTQLARRSIFSFTPEVPVKPPIKSIDELYALKEKERAQVLLAQKELDEFTSDLVELTNQEPLSVTPDANKLFDVYMEYNSIMADNLSNKYPISKLSRRHKQWLALKLSGTYAILQNEEHVTELTYAYAIKTIEFLAEDLQKFEVELVKEPYEQLADLCYSKAEEGKFTMSLHDLRKMGYIAGTGSPKNKILDLATLVNSYDQNATYTGNPDSISYQQRLKTDIIGVSYIIF